MPIRRQLISHRGRVFEYTTTVHDRRYICQLRWLVAVAIRTDLNRWLINRRGRVFQYTTTVANRRYIG